MKKLLKHGFLIRECLPYQNCFLFPDEDLARYFSWAKYNIERYERNNS